jgi:outer membrane receptor for ferrienterochelin and colicin
MRIALLIITLLSVLPTFIPAQERRASVIGLIVAEDGVPLANVRIVDERGNRSVLSAADGSFILPVPRQNGVKLRISRLGFVPRSVIIAAAEKDTVIQRIVLTANPFQLSEVIVTATDRSRRGEMGTVSLIEQKAIEHVQPSSVADVLQLMPGQLAENPMLAGVRQSLLRQVSVSTDANRANALGTAVIVDGVPTSTNGNLQTDLTILNSGPGTLPPFSSTAGRGIDLRQIPADNIESIEVIRGVPSVRYGDLTAGAILINTRAGEYSPRIRARVNPTSTELNAGAGWELSETGPTLAVDGNYTSAQDDPRRAEELFKRITLQTTISHWWTEDRSISSTLRLSGTSTIDEQRQYPDDQRYQRARYSKERGWKMNLYTQWKDAWSFFKVIEFTGSVGSTEQNSFYQDLINREIFPLTTAISETTLIGTYGASEYLNRTSVNGKPLNAYLRFEPQVRVDLFGDSHTFIAGIEWQYTVNHGKGRWFSITEPPRQNYSVGDRPMSFDGIPAHDVLSFYAEDRISGEIFGVRSIVQVGLRSDNVVPVSLFTGRYGTTRTPRINVAFEPMKDLWFRWGYGRTAKSPTLSFLSPGPRYFDLVNINYYAANRAERLTIVTTRIITPNTSQLRSYVTTKREAGVDWNYGGGSISLTGYHETTEGALGMNRFVASMPYLRYSVVQTNAGAAPTIAASSVDTFLAAYDAPVNTKSILNRGLELTSEFPEIRPLRLLISVNGAWQLSRSNDNAPFINTDILFSTTTVPSRVGVYPSQGTQTERIMSSIRFINRIPEIKLVVSLLAQTIWRESDVPVDFSPYPTGFIDKAGISTVLSADEARSPAYAGLVRPYSPQALLKNTKKTALWLFNLRFTKEAAPGIQFSFFVNNLLDDRPLYKSERTGAYSRRNPELFFGGELMLSGWGGAEE